MLAFIVNFMVDSPKRPPLLGLVALAVSLVVLGIGLLLPKLYTDHHDWPGYMIFISGGVAFLLLISYGAGLFWHFIPVMKMGKVYFYAGLALALIVGIGCQSVKALVIGFIVMFVALILISLPKAFR